MTILTRIFNSIVFRANYQLNQIRYVFVKKQFKELKVESIVSTLEKIEKEHVSVSRFGDGEFAWMCMFEHESFQKCSEIMKNRLCEIINSNLPNHIVCIAPELVHIEKKCRRENNSYWRYAIGRHGMAWKDLFDFNKVFYNTNITRFYYNRCCGKDVNSIFQIWKQIWAEKEVLLIEGNKTRFGVGNDLLDSALQVERVIAPSKNAFDRYDEILDAGVAYGQGKVVLVALGPTATILCYDLAKRGIWAIDIGHLDIEYEWFILKAEKKVPVLGKYVNEAGGEKTFVEFSNEVIEKYNSQILEVI